MEQLEQRGLSYNHWKVVYREEFIPFAHGARAFGTYYNDLVKPDDPYEFTMLLKSDGFYALQRNQKLSALAKMLSEHSGLKGKIALFLAEGGSGPLEQFLLF